MSRARTLRTLGQIGLFLAGLLLCQGAFARPVPSALPPALPICETGPDLFPLQIAMPPMAARDYDVPPAAPAPAPVTPAKGELDFDLSPAPAATAEQDRRALAVERLGKLRRRMLTAHQIFGFATLALLTTTVIVG